MKPFEPLHKYFGFNKRERNGIIILTGTILVLLLFRLFLPLPGNHAALNLQKMDELAILNKENNGNNRAGYDNNSETKRSQIETNAGNVSLFPFDPNTISLEEARQLGFPEKTAHTLINFRSKGGKFKSKEDLKKLYGLKEGVYQKLEAYILIPEQAKNTETTFAPPIKNKPAIIEINTADSLQLVYLPMIGPGFTKRILKYRNALGGFYKTEQLKEVYGMADSTYNAIKDKITVNPASVKKINVNVADINELKKHPYITYTIANSIVNYRSKHGLYKSIEDLKEVGTINDATLEKLRAYVSF